MSPRMKRSVFLGAWLLALALAASIPAFAVLRGTVWIGPGSYVANTRLNHPLFNLFGSVTLRKGSSDLIISFFGPVHVHGRVNDDIAAVGSAIYLHPRSVIRKDVVSIGESVYRAQHVRVSGRIGGDVSAWNGVGSPGSPNWFAATWRYSGLSFAAGLALLLICVSIAVAFPWQTVLVANNLYRQMARSVVAGLMGLFLFTFLVVPLGLSLFGLPFALLLAVAAAAAWLLGLTAMAVVVGRKLAGLRRHDAGLLWVVVSGMFAIALAGAIPWMGVLAVGLAGVTGAGSLALTMIARSRPAVTGPGLRFASRIETIEEDEPYISRAGRVAAHGTNHGDGSA